MTKIPLPPLPEPVNFSDVQIEGDTEFNEQYKVPGYTANQLRARDLEVARVVLEAAAKRAARCLSGMGAEAAICALEFTHG